MIALLAVLKNNFYRLMSHKSRIFLCFGLTLGAVLASVFINNSSVTALKVAIVSNNQAEIVSPYLNITYVDIPPSSSELFLGKYDAVVTYSEERGYEVETIKNETFKAKIEAILKNPLSYAPESESIRQIGTSIIGFLTMFILMQGVSTMYLFAEDKEYAQIGRIAVSPVPFSDYLLGHCVFTFLFLLIPTLSVVCFVKYICRIPVGFSFLEYLFLLSVICVLATAFALFIQALIKNGDSANMIGSVVAVLTSILAGSFYSFEENNRALAVIVNVLPQKIFLTFADLLEKNSNIGVLLPHIILLVLISLFFFLTALFITNKTYVVSALRQQKEGTCV